MCINLSVKAWERPACAGNRFWCWLFSWWWSVHPRVCGEQPSRSVPARFRAGSSPRVRGTERCSDGDCCARRFIPACAGNRPLGVGVLLYFPVHPRVCGEQILRQRCSVFHAGSSPRVRGTAQFNGNQFYCHRFIPACAGNRATSARSIPVRSVHPRVCGEQITSKFSNRLSRGSSPRVRGTGMLGHL